jgi:uncharacterized membrane protein YccC
MIAATLGVTAAYFIGALTAAPRWLSVLLFVTVPAGSALIGTALAMAIMPLSYSLGILIITPLSILLSTVLTGSGWLIAVSRAENVLIGVAIAIVAGYLLFPTWLRTSVPGLVTDAVNAIGRYLAMLRTAREAAADEVGAEDTLGLAVVRRRPADRRHHQPAPRPWPALRHVDHVGGNAWIHPGTPARHSSGGS